MYENLVKKISFVIFHICIFNLSLIGKTIEVPRHSSTIKHAVNMALDDDIVVVDDGFYFERNIVIDKKIHLKSKNLFGAVIDGGKDLFSPIFLVRAEAEIEGFVLKNSEYGILQRDSPDVEWTAHDLAILNILGSAICINDREKNVGSASVYNIIADHVTTAFSTNDAGRLEVFNCLVTNSKFVLAGSNHIEFTADKFSVLNCRIIHKKSRDNENSDSPATNKINLGPNIIILDDFFKEKIKLNFESILTNIFHRTESARDTKQSNHSLETLTLNILGNVYFRIEDHHRACQFYKTAIMIGERTGSLEIVWNANYGLAKIYEKLNQTHEAIAYYRKSIDTIENFRNMIPLMESRSAYIQSKLEVYESFISLLFKLYKKFGSDKYAAEAFYLVESFKARALFEGLYESNIDLLENIDPDIKKKMDSILNEISRIQIYLKKSDISKEERDLLITRLEKLEDSFTSLIVRIKTDNQQLANLIYPSSYNYEDVRDRILDSETALIEYYVGRENSFAFLATKQKLHLERIKDPRTLRDLSEKYLLYLTLRNCKDFKGAKGGRTLFLSLMGPFEKKLNHGIKRLIIIPDDSLLYLPYEALVRTRQKVNQDKERLRFLIEDFDISYAPSSSSLINLVNRRSSEARKMDILIMASGHSSVNYPILRNAVREAKVISKIFKKKKRVLLLNKNATEQNLKSLNLNDFKLLHFAVHAILDNEKWHRSALILNPGKDTSEDNLLQPRDLLTFKLNADLVVLSACETRVGKLIDGEGIMGLTRMFLYSGARSVLSSLWKIDDSASLRFMECFYKHFIKGEQKDIALRRAKIEMLNSEYSHPRYWAAFILIGDPSPFWTQ